MSVNVRVLQCTPEDVFRVLGDGWVFPSWVVGASRMRDVDERWPAQGTKLHHSFGVWPILLDDVTLVEEIDAPRRLVMRPKGWPIGEARVIIDVKPRGSGCVVRLEEKPVAGPGRFAPRAVIDLLLWWRNRETLHRLAYLAEGMRSGGAAPSSAEKEAAGEPDE